MYRRTLIMAMALSAVILASVLSSKEARAFDKDMHYYRNSIWR